MGIDLTTYPRPQLQRESYKSLDGQWALNGKAIQVPYPPESEASGFEGEFDGRLMVYERNFDTVGFFYDSMKSNHRLLLHFGAVDQLAIVELNGQRIGEHEGGYLPFTIDITDYVEENNYLKVLAQDTLDHDYPYGKQRKDHKGMWYTPVSGIWQSVWLEVVPVGAVESLKITPTTSTLDLRIARYDLGNAVAASTECYITIKDATIDGEENSTRDTIYQTVIRGETADKLNYELQLDFTQLGMPIRNWTPDTPYLYDLEIKTLMYLVMEDGSRSQIPIVDSVKSYFALREVTIEKKEKYPRICLNGVPIFLHGLLDQGYYTDGIFLPKDLKEYDRDVLRMKELGFNLLRKHIKIELPQFYYACDRLGMLVLQDMVNAGPYKFWRDTALATIGFKCWPDFRLIGRKRKRIFEQHCRDTQDYLYNYPCIIGYTIFNEGWGQYDSDRIYTMLKERDQTRFYDSTSGWFAKKKSDVDSHHIYFCIPQLEGNGKRPAFLSECGGYTRAIEGHMYESDSKYGYGKTDSEDALTTDIERLYTEGVIPNIVNGLCGCIYTQVSDVEEEINGLYTYDRQVCKVNVERMQKIARSIRYENIK